MLIISLLVPSAEMLLLTRELLPMPRLSRRSPLLTRRARSPGWKPRSPGYHGSTRGQLVMLTDAEHAAKAATDAAARLGRQLGHVQQEVAKLAAAGYMGVMQSPMGWFSAAVIRSGCSRK